MCLVMQAAMTKLSSSAVPRAAAARETPRMAGNRMVARLKGQAQISAVQKPALGSELYWFHRPQRGRLEHAFASHPACTRQGSQGAHASQYPAIQGGWPTGPG